MQFKICFNFIYYQVFGYFNVSWFYQYFVNVLYYIRYCYFKILLFIIVVMIDVFYDLFMFREF